MAKEISTSVVFTLKAKGIKNRLSPVFGLRTIVSAGLVLFDRLSDEEKIELIKSLKAEDKESRTEGKNKTKPDKIIETFRKSARKLITMKSKDFTTIIAQLTPDEQTLISQIRDKLGPNGPNKEKEKLG